MKEILKKAADAYVETIFWYLTMGMLLFGGICGIIGAFLSI